MGQREQRERGAARVRDLGPQRAARRDGGAEVDDGVPEALQRHDDGLDVVQGEDRVLAVREAVHAVYGGRDLGGGQKRQRAGRWGG